MNKVFIVIFMVLVLAGVALAGPFLVADTQPDATKYRIRLAVGTGPWSSWVEGPPVSGAMRFDLGGTPAANYKGEAQAGATISVTDTTTGVVTSTDIWSPSAPFGLSVTTSSIPTGIKVQAGP
jgi:hypothetical protein